MRRPSWPATAWIIISFGLLAACGFWPRDDPSFVGCKVAADALPAEASSATDPHPTTPPPAARSLIAFEHSPNDDLTNIYVMDEDGGNVQKIQENADSPAWSPDATRIAYLSDRDGLEDIYIMNADGSNVRRLTRGSGVTSDPVWSPDGTQIAFSGIREFNYFGDGVSAIYVVNANPPRVIARRWSIGTIVSDFPPPLTDHNGWDRDPTWSHDGKQIAFASNRDGDGYDDIYIIDVDSGNVCQIANLLLRVGSGPAWSPDGTRIAFVGWREDISAGGSVIYVMDADGGNVRQLTEQSGFDLTWSPDSTQIGFYRIVGPPGRTGIYVMDVQRGYIHELRTKPRYNGNPAWSPVPG